MIFFLCINHAPCDKKCCSENQSEPSAFGRVWKMVWERDYCHVGSMIDARLMFPLRLWLETVNVLRPPETQVMQPFTHQNLTEDPLIILRCDSRVFRYQATIPHLHLPTHAQNFYHTSWDILQLNYLSGETAAFLPNEFTYGKQFWCYSS